MLDYFNSEAVQAAVPVTKSPYALLVLVTLLIGALFSTVLNIVLASADTAEERRRKRYILVTGCDSGFGKAITQVLNNDGNHVFATCLTAEGVQTLKEDPAFHGTAIQLDITNQEDIERTYDIVKCLLPKDEGLWGLVNNAGVLLPGPIEWTSTCEMRRAMDVNLWGAVDMTKCFLPMIKKSQGRVVNITSIAGRMPFPHAVSYSMSKFAFEAFSDELRLEMRPWGVSVHVIEPGMFQTNILNGSAIEEKWNRLWDSQPAQIREDYGEEYFKIGRKAMAVDLVQTFACARISKVVDSVTHALLSTGPKARYVIGNDANFLWVWVARLPTVLSDMLLGAIASCPLPDAMKQPKAYK